LESDTLPKAIAGNLIGAAGFSVGAISEANPVDGALALPALRPMPDRFEVTGGSSQGLI
jgi:hypothetical protein